MNSRVLCVVALCFVAVAMAGPAVDETPNLNSVHVNEHTTVEEALLKKLNSKCSNRDVSSCMMLKLVTYFNRLLKKSQIEVGDFEITQTTTESVSVNNARSLEEVEKMSEEAQLTTVLADKAMSFLRTRSLKWKATDEAEVVVSGKSDQDEGMSIAFSLRPTPSTNGDARKKKDQGMQALMAAAALKIGLLKALAFKALVLLVGKALLVSKLALVLAAVIGLKKLFSQEKHVTYEVVAHPHHETHHEHSSSGGHDSYGGGGGWGRNYETATNTHPYRAHIPKV
ncbi:uncharacterized protein [Atheta coriaria]|uniref:uncharacterized protein n=1 Tax=Dalotia coriaria TaxID=877792 RepID=UPI0031F4575C